MRKLFPVVLSGMMAVSLSQVAAAQSVGVQGPAGTGANVDLNKGGGGTAVAPDVQNSQQLGSGNQSNQQQGSGNSSQEQSSSTGATGGQPNPDSKDKDKDKQYGKHRGGASGGDTSYSQEQNRKY